MTYWRGVGAAVVGVTAIAGVLQTLGTFGVEWSEITKFVLPTGLLAAGTLAGIVVSVGLTLELSQLKRAVGSGEAPKAAMSRLDPTGDVLNSIAPSSVGLDDSGLIRWWPGRSARIRDEYDLRLRSAKQSIDLIGFGQQHFRDDQKAHFRAWAAAGVKVRILLLDPGFPTKGARSYASQRDVEEGARSGSIAANVKAFLQEVQSQGLENDPHFRVRLYRCLPALNVFRIDDELFWGPYLVHEISRNSPTFLVTKGRLFDEFLKHFERIWDDAELSRDVIWAQDA